MVVPFTTPALQAVVRRITDRPVVFCMIASGVASGAGIAAGARFTGAGRFEIH